jgi:hypothetical protein
MKTSSGPTSISQRVNRFAIATIVAAVILLVFARPSEAKIVYTPTKITIRPIASYNLDLNNDGVTHFTISTSYARTKGGGLSERDC